MSPKQAVWPGRPFPVGAIWDGSGTNFSLFSERATSVELCLFDAAGNETRHVLPARTAHHWHGYLPGVGPGQRYGYRVHGPWAPERGHWFNPAKLLLDPYARAIEGSVRWDAARAFAYAPLVGAGAPVPDPEDSAAAVPRCVVVDPSFDWEGDHHPRTPWTRTVIYETHVKGFTKLHPGVRADLRGTYAGLASEAAIAHLRSLGVTAVELLPVQQIADEHFLHERGLVNHWGYSTIGFFAPHGGYAATGSGGEQVREFKGMVKALHRAGIEVILDVVYNHTGESGPLGPMLSFRGIDNFEYYRLDHGDLSRYVDFTGCGNTLDMRCPGVLRLVMDSLRLWVEEYHVDGFRFDLAPALGREAFDFDDRAAFFEAVHQDPVLSQVKLIAEPWDLGPGGYLLGRFPVLWSEWNDVYRDSMRDLWRGNGSLAAFADSVAGSSALFGPGGRGPSASVNYVTAHDGFTLADLVSYETKHNEANLEGNNDGTTVNRSSNSGTEGATGDPNVLERRARRQRNLLASLLLSQGVPMLLAGDELGRSQGGNNNAWCQDNESSWVDWELDPAGSDLLAFTRRLIALRQSHTVFRRTTFLAGHGPEERLPDAWWFRPDGHAMSEADWHEPGVHAIGLFLHGEKTRVVDGRGRPLLDDSFLLLVNAHSSDVLFTLPKEHLGREWAVELSTSDPEAGSGAVSVSHPPGGGLWIEVQSIVVLRRVR